MDGLIPVMSELDQSPLLYTVWMWRGGGGGGGGGIGVKCTMHENDDQCHLAD